MPSSTCFSIWPELNCFTRLFGPYWEATHHPCMSVDFLKYTPWCPRGIFSQIHPLVDIQECISNKIIYSPCFPRKVTLWVPSVLASLSPGSGIWRHAANISAVSGLRAHYCSDTRPQHKLWVFRALPRWSRVSRVSRAQQPTGTRSLSRSGPRSIFNIGSFHPRQHLKEECLPMSRWIIH